MKMNKKSHFYIRLDIKLAKAATNCKIKKNVSIFS